MSSCCDCVALRVHSYGGAPGPTMKRSYRVERRASCARMPLADLGLKRYVDQRRRNEERFYHMLEVARQLVSLAGDASHHAPVEPLSEQERRILKLFAEGRNSATIARKLSISAQTLRNHLHHINHKLRTHTRLEAVTHAQQRGLLE